MDVSLGDAVRVFSKSANVWMDAKVVELMEGGFLTVEYERGDGVVHKKMCIGSDDLIIQSPTQDMQPCGFGQVGDEGPRRFTRLESADNFFDVWAEMEERQFSRWAEIDRRESSRRAEIERRLQEYSFHDDYVRIQGFYCEDAHGNEVPLRASVIYGDVDSPACEEDYWFGSCIFGIKPKINPRFPCVLRLPLSDEAIQFTQPLGEEGRRGWCVLHCFDVRHHESWSKLEAKPYVDSLGEFVGLEVDIYHFSYFQAALTKLFKYTPPGTIRDITYKFSLIGNGCIKLNLKMGKSDGNSLSYTDKQTLACSFLREGKSYTFTIVDPEGCRTLAAWVIKDLVDPFRRSEIFECGIAKMITEGKTLILYGMSQKYRWKDDLCELHVSFANTSPAYGSNCQNLGLAVMPSEHPSCLNRSGHLEKETPLVHYSFAAKEDGLWLSRYRDQVENELSSWANAKMIKPGTEDDYWFDQWQRELDKSSAVLIIASKSYRAKIENPQKSGLRKEAISILKRSKEDDNFRIYALDPDAPDQGPVNFRDHLQRNEPEMNARKWKKYVDGVQAMVQILNS